MPLVTSLGFGAFLLIAFVGLLVLLFVAASAPGSRGRTLEDLEEQFEADCSTV
ncbi:hypothetical protein [Kocuria rosea]|uniref:hypothetical protein n=1 Tax=Kocuria rosea TaxID=1275 RepID=UPI002041FEB1|nr:hypothetical protein [Kocuria rosea]MCM3688945.1 hypothetical protein [Kocuria rosea]